jgi:hypothetical protein
MNKGKKVYKKDRMGGRNTSFARMLRRTSLVRLYLPPTNSVQSTLIVAGIGDDKNKVCVCVELFIL